jgi:hypothetical protein
MKLSGVLLLLALLQSSPAHVREGDRVEQEFRNHRDRLARYFDSLRPVVEKEVSPAEAEALLRQLESPPPPVGIYGYQMLPRIIHIPQPPTPIRSFSYSWPITEGYVRAEAAKLERATSDLARVAVASRGEKLSLLTELANQYRELVKNQKTIDQYIEYNRFWQRSISESRGRYDRMTEIYWMLKSGNPGTASAIRDVLGKPDAPRHIRIRRQGANHVVLHVRVYTDIEDEEYLSHARRVIEEIWRAEENGVRYAVEIDLRKVSTRDLYRGGRDAPKHGDHVDLDRHVGRFPGDGGVLTTGAEFTYGSVGRYIALGPGDLDPRTLAHEFGHILGFNDGYIRGYTDLGEQGFEILELTAFFDDIMSAPREGHVQPTHFKLLMDAADR